MKKVILSAFVCIILASCENNQPLTSNHEIRLSPGNKDSVVYVNYVDQNGNQNNFFLDYLLFRSLFSSGGYANCYNYYQLNYRTLPSNSYYSSYKPRYRAATSTRTYTSPVKSTASPFRSNSPSKYSSPVRSAPSPARRPSSPVRSTSSPFRRR